MCVCVCVCVCVCACVQVGREWKMLSRHLGVDEVDIDGIQREHYGDLKEAALKALLK